MDLKKILPLTLAAACFGSVLLYNGLLESYAADTLVVGNSAPQILDVPRISQHFVSGEELIVTISATAEDPNGDDYFMNVCADTDSPIRQCSKEPLCRSGLAESNTTVSCEFSLPLSTENIYITLCDDNDTVRCSGPYGTGYAAPVGEPTNTPDVLGATTTQFDSSKARELSILTVGMLGMLAAAMCIYAFNVFKKSGPQRRPVAAGVSSMVIISLTFIGLLAAEVVPPPRTTQSDVLGESITLDPIVESKAGLYEIFAGPSINDEVVFYAKEDEEFPVLRETAAWYEVLLPNGESGWIPASNAR